MEFIKKNFLYVIIGICISLIVILSYKNNKNKTTLNLSKQNIKALTDSVRIEKDKYNRSVSSINVLVSDKKNLGNLNKDLENELKKISGKVYELNKIIGTIKKDTLKLENTIIKYPNNEIGLLFEYKNTFDKNNYRILKGETKFKIIDSINIIPLYTKINDDEIGFDVITGLREKNGNLEIFVTTNYPNLVFTDVKGAIIDPRKNPVFKNINKRKKFNVGPFIGYGYSLNNLKPNVVIGIGVSYKIINF